MNHYLICKFLALAFAEPGNSNEQSKVQQAGGSNSNTQSEVQQASKRAAAEARRTEAAEKAE